MTRPTPQRKSRRITQACDFCHKRGIKCRAAPADASSPGNKSCLTCIEYDQECTRHRQPKKRGTKPRGSEGSHGGGKDRRCQLDNRKIVTALLDVYLDTIHPTFPFFCERELWVGWREGTFPSGSSEYMSLICMCALSAQHVGKRALFTDDMAPSDFASLANDYLQEAVRLVPVDFDSPDIDLIRSYGLLALLGAQEGDTAMIHKYLVLYHGMSARFSLHDEPRWPGDTTECDREVRRRLWWTLYRLEVHTACVLGSLIRCPEAHSDVGYPCGTHHSAFIPGRDGKFENWFEGWNLTTDLYRVLEHAISDFRTRKQNQKSILHNTHGPSKSREISETLSKIQAELLPHFGSATVRSSDSGRNRCGFQAANILCTIHLARMLSTVSDEDNLHAACKTAQEMMQNMEAIPLEYIRAGGSPLVQQLAGVGHMLIGVSGKHNLSRSDYGNLKGVITYMVDFLGHLENYGNVAVTAKQRLLSRLTDVDRRVSASTQEITTETGPQLVCSPSSENLFNDGQDGDVFSTTLFISFTWPFDLPGNERDA
ncbi:hypothetical protein GCG54_00006293 [Colletotrichum gloeosporioides]|uniref:Zn(2)-C6 fungal-type domain-containing protein n=1 Tax=Colletotrichum gloeosporioides TaxID=474922 RepID=A0A8H4CQT9_COLGL|nr:uncharacterized protein GCG54_00006293 [Colletotrichum gloeosporioides]KAF3808435.1 hypothetical protein GCG54_00006293 [Colletotrichum gloeosporioides]